MKKVIRLTETDLINIVKRVIYEQPSDDFLDDIQTFLSSFESGQRRYLTPFIRDTRDLERFLTWIPAGSGLQTTIEKMFGVTCRTSAEIESMETPGEYGFAGKCGLISRFIVNLLNYYLTIGKTPKTLPFETAVEASKLKNLYQTIVRGKDKFGKEYNYGVVGGVYVSPGKLRSEFAKVFDKQSSLFT